MTQEHLIFIPTIFFMGVIAGLLVTSRKSGGLPVLLALGLVLGMFGITHLTKLPIGAGAVQAAIGGAPLFDQSPSFSTAEVLERIEGFGAQGRETYRLMTYTGDVLFPLSLLAFFLAFARFTGGRMRSETWRRLVYALPIAWFVTDMLENALIHTLISSYPTPSMMFATMLGPITLTKFVLLVSSLLGLLLALGLGHLRGRSTAVSKTCP
ncbi:hypothetical protein [Parasedimentitalea huanghaiensis]|uniref:Uncharacterized protein n=1 Tax=Parasedimentitalea huanghaiensis TaxID=2682100 RepID=A0A6L6WKD6_9RHOB|nr:hypothetical protein [Zongyanglinia huanghaiensis]MVO17618.1 hypothetical protein [Zongyanglinia huanghaiensis]